jgi:three-Cys-motif partner protein
MIKRSRDDTVGPWAREKLDALCQYLNFYTTVLKKQSHWLRGTIFFDAFAGPGLSRVRTTEEPVEPVSLLGVMRRLSRQRPNSSKALRGWR